MTSAVTTNIDGLPLKYDTITLYGEMLIDYLWIENKALTDEEVEEYSDYTFRPDWGSNTMLVANYDDNINGGSISSLADDVKYWIVYRKTKNDAKLTYVQKVSRSTDSIIDYGIKNQNEYQYIIFPETETSIGTQLSSDYVTTDWWNWCIADIEPSSDENNLYYADENNIWLFDMNLNSGDRVQNIDKYIYDGLSKYPKISVGQRDYMTGSITCMLGKVLNSQYLDTIEMENNFREFVSNGKLKLLKDRKGNAYVVDITENSFSYLDASPIQPNTITFSWVELENTDNISVVGK